MSFTKLKIKIIVFEEIKLGQSCIVFPFIVQRWTLFALCTLSHSQFVSHSLVMLSDFFVFVVGA